MPRVKEKEQLLDIDRSASSRNDLWKCFVDLSGWYSQKTAWDNSADPLVTRFFLPTKSDYNVLCMVMTES